MKKFIILLCALFFFSTQLFAQDLYEIKWTIEGTRYQAGVIVFNNSYGKARVKYLNEGKYVMVEESLIYESKSMGFDLYGSKPVYPGTETKFPNYIADDFLITAEADGTFTVICADEGGDGVRMQPQGTTIQKITNKKDQLLFLEKFDWKLQNTSTN
ncbi:MAG: hypothetical protein NTX08_02085 [Sphingobacteriales bacterium]|nr:hypothetical protein [Sphingobacteriales bacterium]